MFPHKLQHNNVAKDWWIPSLPNGTGVRSMMMRDIDCNQNRISL